MPYIRGKQNYQRMRNAMQIIIKASCAKERLHDYFRMSVSEAYDLSDTTEACYMRIRSKSISYTGQHSKHRKE